MMTDQLSLWESAHAGAVVVDGYRYTLWRSWDAGKSRVLFIMLNPSVANSVDSDPTLRRCISFARSWSMGSIEIVNLFAMISPYPDVLKQAAEPIGEENDSYIQQALTRAALVVLAWGACKHIGQRNLDIRRLLEDREVHCLGRTQGGFPRHPLYLAHETPLIPYSWKDGNK